MDPSSQIIDRFLSNPPRGWAALSREARQYAVILERRSRLDQNLGLTARLADKRTVIDCLNNIHLGAIVFFREGRKWPSDQRSLRKIWDAIEASGQVIQDLISYAQHDLVARQKIAAIPGAKANKTFKVGPDVTLDAIRSEWANLSELVKPPSRRLMRQLILEKMGQPLTDEGLEEGGARERLAAVSSINSVLRAVLT